MDRRQRPNAARQAGFTLVELLVVISIMMIPLTAVGILLAGGAKSYQTTYEVVHCDVREDVLAVTAAFGSVGRKSNRSNYKVYQVDNGRFTEAVPPQNETIAVGQAVEFRYWQQPFDPISAEASALESTSTGDRYALFYLEGRELKVDYGPVISDVGAVRGSYRNTAEIRTHVLARHVDLSGGSDLFSHTVIGGKGSGAVRLNLVLSDEEGRRAEIKTSTLLRILWPQ